jgi:hypothetical protein
VQNSFRRLKLVFNAEESARIIAGGVTTLLDIYPAAPQDFAIPFKMPESQPSSSTESIARKHSREEGQEEDAEEERPKARRRSSTDDHPRAAHKRRDDNCDDEGKDDGKGGDDQGEDEVVSTPTSRRARPQRSQASPAPNRSQQRRTMERESSGGDVMSDVEIGRSEEQVL